MMRIICIFLYLSSAMAMELMYQFVKDESVKYGGDCYEIDKETNGNRFSKKVTISKCVPAKTTFIWSQKKDSGKGTCFQVDEQTLGEKYVRKAKAKKCRPLDFRYVLLQEKKFRPKCFMIDAATAGERFKAKAPRSKCKTGKADYKWKPYEDKAGGNCISKIGGYEQIVNYKNCRPAEVEHTLIEGYCYEYHPGGWQYYSKQVNKGACAKQRGEFYWKADSSGLSGGCYQKVIDVNGETKYERNSKVENCKPDRTTFMFKANGKRKGSCFEIDKATLGQQYVKKVQTSKCAPEATNVAWMTINRVFGCYRIDAKKGEEVYYEKMKRTDCPKRMPKTYWISAEDSWGGGCYSTREIFGESRRVKLQSDKCRPENYVHYWRQTGKYKGECYEVDPEKGPASYSRAVGNRYCRPKEDFRAYIYVRNAKTAAEGTCYTVDAETKGTKFIEKANVKYCRLQIQERDLATKFKKLEEDIKSKKGEEPGQLLKEITEEYPHYESPNF